MNLFSRGPLAKKMPAATPQNPAVEIICLWEPAEGTGLDGLPCRGFAGQMLFFTAGRDEPVQIDGDVRIYVFDDQGTPEEQSRPLHQFDFEGVVFQQFLTETNLGVAYQMFIPYTRKGAPHATCSLRVRLTSPSGRNIYSKMASVVLAGRKARESFEPGIVMGESRLPLSGIQQAGFEVPSGRFGDRTGHEIQPIAWDRPGRPVQTERRGQDRNRLKSSLSDLVEDASAEPAAGPSAGRPGKLRSSDPSPRPPQEEPQRHPLLEN